MFFLTNKMEEDLTQMSYEEGYEDGYKAAQLSIAEKALEKADRALEGLEDADRRLEQVYRWAYEQGALDALAKHGIIEIDDIEEIAKELEKQ